MPSSSFKCGTNSCKSKGTTYTATFGSAGGKPFIIKCSGCDREVGRVLTSDGKATVTSK